MAVASEELHAAVCREGIDGGQCSLVAILAEGAEKHIDQWVKPAAHMYHPTTDNAGVGDVDFDFVPIASVELFSKKHYGHFAVGIGFDLAVIVFVEIEKVVTEMGYIAGE